MQIEDAVSLCMKNGIKVYPVSSGRYHKIEYSLNSVPKQRYSKVLDTPKKVSDAMIKTYLYLAEKGVFV